MRKKLVLVMTLLGLAGLAGCGATVDQFSSRAATYNDQAASIKEDQFLTNIMRAAYREPLEFSDFTQVTGQSSLSGTLGFSLPISAFPARTPRSYLTTPSATVAGTQSFTVANLDTQAFYEGILSPVPLSTLDYYLEADYPKALVLTLFISHIKLEAPSVPEGAVDYYNSVYGNFPKFEAVLDAAIDLGLTTEPADRTQPVGPPLTEAQLPSLKYLAALGGTHMALKTFPFPDDAKRDPNLTSVQRAAFARQHVSQYYRLVSTTQKSQFCFAGNPTQAEIAAANGALQAAGVMHPGRQLLNLQLPATAQCGSDAPATDDADPDAGRMIEIDFAAAGAPLVQKYRIVITTRSVEGILYYLGEWVRAELAIGDMPKTAPPLVETGRGQDALFEVRRDCGTAAPDVGVAFFGGKYCMRIDPTGADRSAQVMEIVSQLFALNNSAQNLPSPNVISVLSP